MTSILSPVCQGRSVKIVITPCLHNTGLSYYKVSWDIKKSQQNEMKVQSGERHETNAVVHADMLIYDIWCHRRKC